MDILSHKNDQHDNARHTKYIYTLSVALILIVSVDDLNKRNCQYQIRIIMLNEFTTGEKIVMPKSVLRTISLQKLRNPSPQPNNTANALKENVSKNNAMNQMQNKYEKILDKKLGFNRDDHDNKGKTGNNDKMNGKKKFQEFKKEVKENEMKECTFKPVINPTQKGLRSVNSFFKDQLTFCQKKNDKIEEMRAMIEANKVKENIFRPNAMLNREHKPEDIQNIHNRLYEQSKNKEREEGMQRQQSVGTMKSNSITKSKRFQGLSRGNSSQKVSKTETHKKTEMASQQFYKISLHTNNDNSIIDMSSVTSRKPSVQIDSRQTYRNQSKQCQNKQPCKRVDLNIYQKKENPRNEQLCITKLMREMAIVIEKCGLPMVFNYIQMNLFFQKMNFIPKESSDNTRKILYEIWDMLQGQIFKEVSSLSIMKLVYAIMGHHNVNIVNKCIHDFWLSNQAKVETYDHCLKEQGKQLSLKQNLLMITERDSKTIKSTFEELYLNRLKLGESQLIKDQKGNEYAFKPSISKASIQLAEKYRNRVLQQSEQLMSMNKLDFEVPEDGQIDHVNLLMLDEKRKDAVIRLKREQREKEKRKIQDESMISMNQTERSSNRSKNGAIEKDRNQELYEMSKIPNNRRDKSTDQIQQQKWKKELTFKPNIKSRTNILNALNSKENYIPDYDKTVYRMHQGRKIRENGHMAKQPQNTSPLFYLNVVMQGSQSVKIPIYSQDNMKTITDKVRQMMDLETQGSSSKLQRILKMQIQPALMQMGIQIE